MLPQAVASGKTVKDEHSPEVAVYKKIVEGREAERRLRGRAKAEARRRLRGRTRAGSPQKCEGYQMVPCAEGLQMGKSYRRRSYVRRQGRGEDCCKGPCEETARSEFCRKRLCARSKKANAATRERVRED